MKMKTITSFISVAAICLVIPLTSCKPGDEFEESTVQDVMPQEVLVTDLAPLVGSNWKLVDLCGEDVSGETSMTLEFMPEERISGGAAVNRFNGSLRLADDGIEVGPMATTRMAGPPEAMELESTYLAALAAAKSISTLGADKLIIAVEDKDLPLRFESVTEP